MYIQVKQNIGKTAGTEIKIPKKIRKRSWAEIGLTKRKPSSSEATVKNPENGTETDT